MKGTVDRIEENFAVCEMEGRVMQNIPLSAFRSSQRMEIFLIMKMELPS